jgi:class 3 adenylate cyclase
MLNLQRSPEQLLGQIDKLLNEGELLSARFAAISDFSVSINSSLRPAETLDVMVSKARHALGFDYCGVGMLNDNADEYSLSPLVWPTGTYPSPGEQVFNSSAGLPGSVIVDGKPLIVRDLLERPLKVRPTRFVGLLNPDLEGKLAAAGLRSMMALPLFASGRMLGCLLFAKCDPDFYNQDDLQLAYLFSVLLATALRNSQLFDAETRRSYQLQLLSEVGQTATSILDPNELLSKVPALIRAQFGYEVVKIGMIHDTTVVYASNAQYIAGSPRPADLQLPVSVSGRPIGIVGLAAFTGQMVLVPDIFEDDRWADVSGSLTGPHIRSVLVIPMAARNRTLGVLHFESERIEAFGSADISILQSLANQLGVALDNARLYQQLNELFHGYIAPQVASTLLDNPNNAQLGGQKREVTVLFADLDGFTGLSEKIPPEQLLELLNVCLGVASDAILEYGGTIDKYMGDAVMALFNAPQDQADHSWRAVKAAIAMQRKLRHVTAKWEHKMVFSVGINTGEAVVGNIGSASLRNFTAIGDSVNLAKRIQEMAAPGQILVSKQTHEMALTTARTANTDDKDGNIVTYRLGTEILKGRTQPAVIYEIYPYSANSRMFLTRPIQPSDLGETSKR